MIVNMKNLIRNGTSVDSPINPSPQIADESQFGIVFLNKPTFELGRELERMLSEEMPVLALHRAGAEDVLGMGNNNPFVITRRYRDLDGLASEIISYAQVLRGERFLVGHLLKPRSLILENGLLRVDYRSQSVEYNGVEIHLTVQAYQIIELLAHRVGKLVSREELIGRIWSVVHPDESKFHILSVGVHRLRRCFPKDCPDLIETHNGMGYRMKDFRVDVNP